MAIQYSIQKMVSDGTLSTIALGIQYLQRNDIYIRIAGEETPQSGAHSGYTWSFIDNTTLKILPVVPNGVEVVVYRRTDIDAMYNIYSQNAQFDEATIDENNQQLLYIAQEYLEQGIPGAGVDIIEFIRDDGSFTYYRIKRTDGSYSDEFAVPSASSSTKVLTREALRRSYAEAGYNLVGGSFEAGGTLVNANDVLLHEASGEVFSGPAGNVSAGTNPTLPSSGYVPRTDAGLRRELAGADGAQLISFTQSGSGAVSRTVDSKLSDVISVKDFGAVGDGYTDDTDAIKAAIVAAVAYSDRAAAVHFPGGFYNVSATIEVPSWVQLVGDGIETSQLRCLDTSVEHIALLPNGSQYNGIRGMTVRYATMPTSSGIGIGIKSYHPYFQQIKVTECYIGIKIYENDSAVSSNATGVFVEQFQINDCSYVGLMVGNSNSGFCNDITFRDGLMLTNNPNYFYLGGIRIIGRVESLTMTNIDMIGGRLPYTADAGSTEGLRFSTFTGVFFDSGAARCEFGRMRHCQFTNCWISGGRTSGTEGAYFTDVQNTTFAGLRVYNCGGSGLVFDNCSYINIVEGSFGLNNANSLSAPQWHMQFGSTCSHFTVQNCTSNESSGTIAAGVRVESGSTYYTIEGNHFGQVTAPVSEGNSSAQGRFVADNAFYNTYSTGSGSLASGTTSTTVSHGLAVVPQIKQVRIQQNGASVTPLYVQSVNGTNITVATQTSNSSAAPFTWEVDATRY